MKKHMVRVLLTIEVQSDLAPEEAEAMVLDSIDSCNLRDRLDDDLREMAEGDEDESEELRVGLVSFDINFMEGDRKGD